MVSFCIYTMKKYIRSVPFSLRRYHQDLQTNFIANHLCKLFFFSSLQLCVFLYFLFIFPLYAILWPYNFGKLSFHVKTLAKGKQSKIIKVKLRSHYTFISFIRRNRRAGPNLPFSKTKLKHFKRKHIYIIAIMLKTHQIRCLLCCQFLFKEQEIIV